MGGAANKAGNRYERRWALLALLDVLTGKARSLQVEVPGENGVGAEFQVIEGGLPIWHQVKRQRAEGPWTIKNLASGGVLAPWWPKISGGGRFVFVSSTSARDLAELAERASAAESWSVFDAEFLTSAANRERFERLRTAWGSPPGAAVYAALRSIDVRQIGERDLTDLVQARLATLVSGRPATAMAVLEQFIDDSTHQRLTAQDVWARLAEHGLRRKTGTNGGGHGRHARGSGPVIQLAESSGNGQVTQVAGDYYNFPAPTKTGWARRPRITPFRIAAAVAVVTAVSVAAVVLTSGPSRLPVHPLPRPPRAKLEAIPIPAASLQPWLAKKLGRSGTVYGYQFTNAWPYGPPVCLDAVTSGPLAGRKKDPVQISTCNGARNQIWIPVQWEKDHEKFTWLVNYQYQSKCLNVDNRRGLADGHGVQLWDCYPADNEFWDFGDWYDNVTNMKSGINPYPIRLGSTNFCLDADKINKDQNTGILPDGTKVTIWDYYWTPSNQYWS